MAKTPPSLTNHATAPINKALSAEEKINLYTTMVRIRKFEQVSMRSYNSGKMGGFLHLYIGQESVAVGTVPSCQLPAVAQSVETQPVHVSVVVAENGEVSV